MALRVPPGPNGGLFGLRTVRRMKADVLQFYRDLHREFGDCTHFHAGPFRVYTFFHPQEVHDVLVTHSKSIIRDPRVMRTFAQWNGNSILTVEGEAWVRQRRLVQPGFQPRRFENYGRIMTDCAARLADAWRDAGESGRDQRVNIRQAMTGLTLEIIGRTMLDVDLTADSGEISKAVAILSEVAFHEMQAPFLLPGWWPTEFYRRKRWAVKTLDDVVWRIVRQRRAEGTDHGDLLSMLLAAVDDAGDGGQLTDRQVRDEATTLLLAGHDTSAAALEWLCYLLAAHPEVAARCRQEVRDVLGDRDAGIADLPRLNYITAVVKETLRLSPPAIGVFLRRTMQPLVIGGYDVPRDSLIALSSYVTHRDPRWFSEPERFRPERFLPSSGGEWPAAAYFPFGAGPRVCIGQSFAMMEMTLIVAALVRRIEFVCPPESSPPTPMVHMSLRPRQPIELFCRSIRSSMSELSA